MLRFVFCAATALAVLSGCVPGQQAMLPTPSGRPEAMFPKAPDQVVALLVSRCMDKGLIVYDQSPSFLTCGRQTSGAESVVADMAVGGRYSTTPERKIRFTLVATPAGTRVMAHEWIEAQNAFGQVMRQEITSSRANSETQASLLALGGTVPGSR